MNDQPICLSLYTEDRPGVLGRVAATFSRRRINIDSLLVSRSGIDGLHRFTVCIRTSERNAHRIALQLERQVDVVSARVHPLDQTSLRSLSLYRLPAGVGRDMTLQAVVRRWAARFIHTDERCTLLEFTGAAADAEALREALAPWDVLEFASSGAIALEHTDRRVLDNPSDPQAGHPITAA